MVSFGLPFALLFLLAIIPSQFYGEESLSVFNSGHVSNESDRCDLFNGQWVIDESTLDYYGSDCPFINPSWNCEKNGRPDKTYLKYKWKPTNCYLAKFNGKDFLKRMKGKKIMFVGDSLSYNSWESLACMLHNALPTSNYTLTISENITTISFPGFEVSISIMQSEYLVDVVPRKIGRVLTLDSLNESSAWKGIDILSFNTYHWWLHTGKLQDWDFIQVGDKIVKDMDRMEAYKIALTTWANWIDFNIDTSKTKVFFQGISAIHYLGESWGEPGVKNCIGQTQAILGSDYPGQRYLGEPILKGILANMTSHVELLDITLLTQLRKDGHPSQYGNPGAVDCSHWCLSGVPDTWNQILYTILRGH